MKFSSTYIFGLVVVALGLYTYFFEFKVAEEEKRKETEGVKLMREINKDDVENIRLQKGTSDIELVKKDGKWLLENPFKEAADKATVDSILSSLAVEKEEPLKAEAGEKLEPKNYGFDLSSGFIEVKTKNAKKKYVISGQKTFDGRQYHIMEEGKSDIFLASSTFGDLLDKPIKEVRAKDLFGEVNPKAITIKYKDNPEASLELVGKDWVYAARPGLKLDPKAVNDWIMAVKYVKIEDFPSETSGSSEKKKYGLDKPQLYIKLKTEDKTLELWAATDKEQKVFVTTNQRPNIFEVTSSMISPLEKSLEDFRDKKFPFTFDEKTVTKIEVERPGFNLGVAKEPNKEEWKLVSGSQEINQSILKSMLTKVRELSVDRFLKQTEKSRGLNPVRNKIVLKDQSGNTVLDLSLGAKTEEGPDQYIFARTNLAEEIILLKSSKIDELMVDKIIKAKNDTTDKKPNDKAEANTPDEKKAL